MIDEQKLEFPVLSGTEQPRSEESPVLEPPAPHQPVKLEGVLCCGRRSTRTRSEISEIVLEPLAQWVRQVVDWSGVSGDTDAYLGDYRFLVLSLQTASGADAFVQIWSDPFREIVMEVGPGNRKDALLQAFADTLRDPLLYRGFAIGGNADNYRKALSVIPGEEAFRIAHEMMGILFDVLRYEGCSNLEYRFEQNSHLRDAHVLTGIGRSELKTLLQRWGLRATLSVDEEVIEAASLEQKFQLQLHCAHRQRKGDYWEIHCLATLPMAPDAAAALIRKVNERPFLLKAYAVSALEEPIAGVGLAHGINLAGGVTLGHIRCQISELLQTVRNLSNDRKS